MKYLIILLTLFLTACAGSDKQNHWAYGDSITEGSDFGSGLEGYAYYIAEKMNWNHINRGFGGSRLQAPQQIDRILNDNIKRGDVVTLLTGYNDVRLTGNDPVAIELYSSHLDKAFSHWSEIGVKVYVGNCLRMIDESYSQFAPYDKATNSAVESYNKTIADIAAKYENVVLIDVSKDWEPSTQDYLQSDKVHPSIIGADALSNLFVEAIRHDAQ